MKERVPAEAALQNSAENAGAKWPTLQDAKRISPYWLPNVTTSFTIEANQSIFTIGSCFARNIEFALKQRGFKVPALDFSVPVDELHPGTRMVPGILNKYTPHSMLNEVKFAFSDTDGSEFLIEIRDGLYLDGQLHTNTPVSYSRGIERRQQIRKLYMDAVMQSDVIIITLGLIESWWDSKYGVFLNETPHPLLIKRNPERFFFEVLSVNSAIDAIKHLITELRLRGAEGQKIIVTVSPVPIVRTFTKDDVIIANSYSKAVLRVAAEYVSKEFTNVDYFPSYESIAHSDHAITWENDLIHVREDAVISNVGRMLSLYVN